ncbi:ABC transporter ATP-binding protein [Chryseomicrobium palamuruense]|uniref:ABC transporter ATP-binding protein n=1 Tax=Chryseomicrobium palamuruense TaxID=682973 RepID=A0ABV8UVP4_9BACL
MLNIHNVSKVFNEGSVDEKVAIDHLTLDLQAGDFVTIIGSNGAGKSTLMNCVSGALPTDEGTIEIDGRRVDTLPEYKRSGVIGRVFQDPMAGTSPSLTIEENLAVAFSRHQKRTFRFAVSRSRQQQFKEHLETLHLNLENRMTTKVGMLSGGERQALSLLMATFTNPSILLLDEHTAALDPARAELITQLTKELVSANELTTLMVTHNMQQAIDLGNRLIMMDQGKIIFEASEEEKKQLTITDLLHEFKQIKGSQALSDRMLLEA